MRFLQPHRCFSPAAITAPKTGGWSKTRRPWRPTSPITAHGWARRRPRCRPSGCGAGSSKRCARPTPGRSGASASGSAGSKPPPRPSPSPTPKSAPRCATPSSSGYTTRSPARHRPGVPLARHVGLGRRPHRPRLGRLPHPQRRHPAPGGPPHPAPVPLHPLGHEGSPAGDRLDESPHADRLRGIRENRTLKNFPEKIRLSRRGRPDFSCHNGNDSKP